MNRWRGGGLRDESQREVPRNVWLSESEWVSHWPLLSLPKFILHFRLYQLYSNNSLPVLIVWIKYQTIHPLFHLDPVRVTSKQPLLSQFVGLLNSNRVAPLPPEREKVTHNIDLIARACTTPRRAQGGNSWVAIATAVSTSVTQRQDTFTSLH